jgi:hypothetical protein
MALVDKVRNRTPICNRGFYLRVSGFTRVSQGLKCIWTINWARSDGYCVLALYLLFLHGPVHSCTSIASSYPRVAKDW